MSSSRSTPSRCVFIGGCSRSGTTFLGSVLGTARGAVTTPESQFKSHVHGAIARGEIPEEPGAILDALGGHWRFRLWGSPLPPRTEGGVDLPSAILKTVAEYAHRKGVPDPECWIDHSPDNIRDGPWLLKAFPEVRIVHLVRDGRAVAASLMQLDLGPNTPSTAAKLWVQSVGTGLAMESAYPDRVVRVKYEDVVKRPEETIRGLCEFVGLPYAPRMVEGGEFIVPEYTRENHKLVGTPPDVVRIERWRDRLEPREIEIFESIAGPMLEALGYDLVFGGAARPPTWVDRLGVLHRDHLWGRVRSRLRHWRRRRRSDV